MPDKPTTNNKTAFAIVLSSARYKFLLKVMLYLCLIAQQNQSSLIISLGPIAACRLKFNRCVYMPTSKVICLSGKPLNVTCFTLYHPNDIPPHADFVSCGCLGWGDIQTQVNNVSHVSYSSDSIILLRLTLLRNWCLRGLVFCV